LTGLGDCGIVLKRAIEKFGIKDVASQVLVVSECSSTLPGALNLQGCIVNQLVLTSVALPSIVDWNQLFLLLDHPIS
jgi:hypothetical protein